MCEVYKNVHKHIENRRDNEETSIENYKLGYINNVLRCKHAYYIMGLTLYYRLM